MPLVLAAPAFGGGRRRNNRPRTAAGTPAPNNPRDEYDRRLRRYVAQYLGPTAQEIMRSYAEGATMDEIAAILDRLQVETADTLTEIALKDLQGWFIGIDGYNKKRFEDSIRRTMGIDAKSILDPVLADETRRAAISENVALIRGMTREFHGDIMSAIVADYRGDGFPDGSKSLAGRIRNLTDMTKERASFIARDQTAKLNSVLAEARQTDAGITHYEWRTAGDRRVVGTPGGPWKPSKQHGNHYERDGKIFSWKKPPVDGPPGISPGCRCIAAPVIDPRELRMVDLTTGTVRYRETG
jgi:SPP1 gp7 family putative phage head morphogenesis protein